jgi:hypothetical protein
LENRVKGARFRVLGLRLWVYDIGFNLGLRVQTLGLGNSGDYGSGSQGSGVRVQGLRFRV